MPYERIRGGVIGVPVDVIDWQAAITRISEWAGRRESRTVCICNAHSLVTARSDKRLRDALNDADMVTSDGFPVALLLRWTGHREQQRINGPDLMLKYCAHIAGDAGQSIFLFGSTESTLAALRDRLAEKCPGLKIAGMLSPPFREVTPEEDARIVDQINESGASVVWVGLGCPKQEKWMKEHQGKISAVMIGVGAAFDYHAGVLRRAPSWMQMHGLEWLYRLACEPKRLWKRYAVTNSLFVLYAVIQLMQRRLGAIRNA